LSMSALAMGGAIGCGVVAMLRYGDEAAVEELPASSWGRVLWWRWWAPVRDVGRAFTP
jgi:hypothetical protein